MAAGTAIPPVALTMGEPAGIGGEIALKAWLRRGEGLGQFFVVDDPDRLAVLARRLNLTVPISEIAMPGAAADRFAAALPVLRQDLAVAVEQARP